MVIPKTYGRLGNFLFQAASAMSYAWDHNLEYTLPNETKDAKWNPIYLQHLVNPKFNPDLPSVVVKEKAFTYHPRAFQTDCKKNIVLDGYWQSEKYFKHYRERILGAFRLPWELDRGLVSVHVRRGDYLTIKKGGMFKHPPVPPEWILEQIEKFPRESTFIFFSDDIEWCSNTFKDRRFCFTWTDEVLSMGGLWDDWLQGAPREMVDLVLMSNCEHHICSASTFSWWGAWLNQNPNKRVIMPKHWITPGWGNIDTSEVVPTEWERA